MATQANIKESIDAVEAPQDGSAGPMGLAAYEQQYVVVGLLLEFHNGEGPLLS